MSVVNVSVIAASARLSPMRGAIRLYQRTQARRKERNRSNMETTAELIASEKVPFGRYSARCDVLEYCPSELGDTHEATAVHYVFRRDACCQYTIVVASRAVATVGDAVGRAPKLREA